MDNEQASRPDPLFAGLMLPVPILSIAIAGDRSIDAYRAC
jgi:hypothetical protein